MSALAELSGVPRSGQADLARNRGTTAEGPRRPRFAEALGTSVEDADPPLESAHARADHLADHLAGTDADPTLSPRARRRSRLFRYGERVRVTPSAKPRRLRAAPPASARALPRRASLVVRERRAFATRTRPTPRFAPIHPRTPTRTSPPRPRASNAVPRATPRTGSRAAGGAPRPLAALFLDEPAPSSQHQVAAMANKSNRHARHARAGTLRRTPPRAALPRRDPSAPGRFASSSVGRQRGRPRRMGRRWRVVQGLDDAGGVGRRRRRGQVARRSTRARRHPVRRRGLARHRGRSGWDGLVTEEGVGSDPGPASLGQSGSGSGPGSGRVQVGFVFGFGFGFETEFGRGARVVVSRSGKSRGLELASRTSPACFPGFVRGVLRDQDGHGRVETHRRGNPGRFVSREDCASALAGLPEAAAAVRAAAACDVQPRRYPRVCPRRGVCQRGAARREICAGDSFARFWRAGVDSTRAPPRRHRESAQRGGRLSRRRRAG